jgi:hypothetical protein
VFCRKIVLNATKEQQMLIQSQQQIRTQQRPLKAQQTRGEIQQAPIISLSSSFSDDLLTCGRARNCVRDRRQKAISGEPQARTQKED